MEGYNRFFIVGLILIGLVDVYAGNRGGPSAQQSTKSLLAIEDAAAQLAAEETPRMLKKRSNPHSYPPVSKEGAIGDYRALDLTMKTQREYQEAQEARKTQELQKKIETAKRIWDLTETLQLNGRSVNRSPQARPIQEAQGKRYQFPEAKQKQPQSFDSRAVGSRSSRGQRPG